METFEEEDREPQLQTSIQGVAKLNRNSGISIIGDAGTYSRVIHFSISSQNYKDIVQARKKWIEKYGVNDDLDSYCNDTLGTHASIHHMYAEYSEVGKLWDESWSVMLTVPNNLMQQLLETIQFYRTDHIETGLNLLGIYTDEDPNDFSDDRDQPMLFLMPKDDERRSEDAFGYIYNLSIGSRKRAPLISRSLVMKLLAIQALLKKIKTTLYIAVIILLLYALFSLTK